MRRGEIWTIAGGGDSTGKPRPAVIIQDDSFDATAFITVCACTTDPTEAPLFRIPIELSETNDLRAPSRLLEPRIPVVVSPAAYGFHPSNSPPVFLVTDQR